MSHNRKEIIKKFINEGFTYRTLSLFSDHTINKQLSKKLFTEQVSEKTTEKSYISSKKELAELCKWLKADELEEVETEKTEERNIETDPTGNPDVDIDGEPLLVELPQECRRRFCFQSSTKISLLRLIQQQQKN